MSILKVNTIQDKGGNTLLSSDGAGAISSGGAITNTPAFFGYQSSTQSISNASWTKITFNTERWDTSSAFDLSNSKFTVPTGYAGKYYLSCHIEIPGVDGNERAILAIQKNGSRVDESYVNEQKASADRVCQLTSNIVLDLSVGDYIEAVCYQDSGDAQNALYGWLQGYKLIGA